MATKRPADDFEFDIESSPALTRKFVAAGLGSIFAFCLLVSGSVFMMNRAPSQTAGFRLPSLTGILVSVQSGGRVSPYQWDNIMNDMCTQMAGVSNMMSGDDSSASRNNMKRAQAECRK